MKSQGKKPKTWDDFHKAMIAVSLSDLHEEAAEIAQQEDIYAEVRAMRTIMTGLTPAMARTNLQTYRASLTLVLQMSIPTRQPPPQYSTPAPRNQPVLATPGTPALNRQQYVPMPGRNTLQATLGTNRNLFVSPATGTNAIPV